MRPEGTAVVTGASRGIGRAVALELARQGFSVVAAMRSPDDGRALADELGPAERRLAVERMDLTDPDTIRLPTDLSVLVNNAAVEAPHPTFEATPMSTWREMFETNLFGLIEVTRRAVGIMRERGRGVICNVTSSSLLAPVPFYGPYRASKAAVTALTETLRTELLPLGIRVIEILPGAIATDMLARSEESPVDVDHPSYRPMAERFVELRRPLTGRGVPPGEAARAIVEAICDDAGPMRYSCDPMGAGLLEAWRAQGSEQLMDAMTKSWMSEEP
jgi:NAD(P)-dependent dehydrogenase (short-subunit alcohol dehydrogenase family)